MVTLNYSQILSDLISLRPVTGNERPALEYVEQLLSNCGYSIEKIPVEPNRYNLLCFLDENFLGVLTTHIDVVPAPEELFEPKFIGSRLIGRGAVDALGALVSMIYGLEKLRSAGIRSVALLVVVGEERDGIGAKMAAGYFSGREIQFLINGEPTENKLASGQKGCVAFELEVHGKTAHSGYPEAGHDANRVLLNLLNRLQSADFGTDSILGASTVSIGTFRGGAAINVISDQAEAAVAIRTVGDTEGVISKVHSVVDNAAAIKFVRIGDALIVDTIPGFAAAPVSFTSDLSYLYPIAGKRFMCGPGSILRAHTDGEYIDVDELEEAAALYFDLSKAALNFAWR